MGTTKQRRRILEILSVGCEHMTAEGVFEKARQGFPSIGRGTVYRNLNLMADAGKIRRLHLAGQPVRFDINTLPHQHIVCAKCGKIADIADIEHEKIRPLVNSQAKILECALTITVVCEACNDEAIQV